MARKRPEDAKPDAWMPLFLGELLADTSHLTTEQFGAYLLLLVAAWRRKGYLPSDAAQLQAITRLQDPAWKLAWPILSPLFEYPTDPDGRTVNALTQRRLLAEYQDAVERYAKRVASSAAGVAARRSRTERPADDEPNDPPNGGPNDPPNEQHNHNHNHNGGTASAVPTVEAGGGSFEPDGEADLGALVDAARMRLQGAGAAAVALRKVGVQVTSQNPDLLAAITAGVTIDHLLELAALHGGKPIRYLTSAAMRELAERPAGEPVPPGHGGSSSPRLAAPASRTDGVSPRRVETPATRLEAAQSYVADMQRYGTMDAAAAAAYLKPYEDAARADPST